MRDIASGSVIRTWYVMFEAPDTMSSDEELAALCAASGDRTKRLQARKLRVLNLLR